uniref:RING-type domain-containing protein n=1 Tax=Meloidogyne hapla TaxID=6305 RepID=A0A1I8BQG7_MELHA
MKRRSRERLILKNETLKNCLENKCQPPHHNDCGVSVQEYERNTSYIVEEGDEEEEEDVTDSETEVDEEEEEQQQHEMPNVEKFEGNNRHVFPTNFKLREAKICVFCLRKKAVIFMLCGHVCFCYGCSKLSSKHHRIRVKDAKVGDYVPPLCCAICRFEGSYSRIDKMV